MWSVRSCIEKFNGTTNNNVNKIKSSTTHCARVVVILQQMQKEVEKSI